jgi:hypothetical protein
MFSATSETGKGEGNTSEDNASGTFRQNFGKGDFPKGVVPGSPSLKNLEKKKAPTPFHRSNTITIRDHCPPHTLYTQHPEAVRVRGIERAGILSTEKAVSV